MTDIFEEDKDAVLINNVKNGKENHQNGLPKWKFPDLLINRFKLLGRYLFLYNKMPNYPS